MTWLTWALSKSFCELPSVAAAGVYGKGTREVSWLTYRSTRPLPRVAREIPSGIDSSRNSPSSVVMTSPTVSSGVTLLPGATPTSIAGRAVLKPPLAAFAGTTPKAIRPVARMLVSARRRETRCGKRGTGAPPLPCTGGDGSVVSARDSASTRGLRPGSTIVPPGPGFGKRVVPERTANRHGLAIRSSAAGPNLRRIAIERAVADGRYRHQAVSSPQPFTTSWHLDAMMPRWRRYAPH